MKMIFDFALFVSEPWVFWKKKREENSLIDREGMHNDKFL